MSYLSDNRPSAREAIILTVCLVTWMSATATFIGLRPEHSALCAVLAVLFILNKQTRKLMMALLPFAVFGISYDWMRIKPNYEVNPIDVRALYDAEKGFFGIATATGTLTPNEFFAIHHCTFMDFMSGVFYLCWVPVPILFGLGLYFTRQRRAYLHFALVFLFVNLIGFAGYYIHPAAPPWYVMKHGFEVMLDTPGNMAGLARFGEITGWHVFESLYGRNANVFAAIPSLHSAYMVVTLFYSLHVSCPKWLRAVFAVIMVGIWFTAVYTAQHYTIDVMMGILCALLGIFIFEMLLMRIPAFDRFIDRYTAYID